MKCVRTLFASRVLEIRPEGLHKECLQINKEKPTPLWKTANKQKVHRKGKTNGFWMNKKVINFGAKKRNAE